MNATDQLSISSDLSTQIPERFTYVVQQTFKNARPKGIDGNVNPRALAALLRPFTAIEMPRRTPNRFIKTR